ncbi:unnamed protein product [Phytomonas sp. Hart1]|nr:unnamed protein product [Phytomonas sp. Hart1]|eukprot:CCW70831.1 unnamed protein product [Phytomonas sp. isolate Hart1]
MASKILVRAGDDKTTTNGLLAALEYRSTPDQRSAHFEDIYSNYALLKAQADELQLTKRKIDSELFQSNHDRIGELLFEPIEVDQTDWGDWDTWKKVETVVRKFVYGQSPNVTKKPDVLESMKKNTALLNDVNKDQAERIRLMESSMLELQSEIGGLRNLLQLKERNAQSFASKNRMLVLQVRQKQREVNELGGKNTDEKELVRDFKLVIDANKRLEKENMELRAKLNVRNAFLGISINEKEVKANRKELSWPQRHSVGFNSNKPSPTRDAQKDKQVDLILQDDTQRLRYLFNETPISAIWTTLNRRVQAWMQRLEGEVNSTMAMLDHDANLTPFCDETGGLRFERDDDAFLLPSPGVFTLYRGYNKNCNALDEIKAHLPVSVSCAPRDDFPYSTPTTASGTIKLSSLPREPSNTTAISSTRSGLVGAQVDPKAGKTVLKRKKKRKDAHAESTLSLSHRSADGKAPSEASIKPKKNARASKEGDTGSIASPTPVPHNPSDNSKASAKTEPVQASNRVWATLSKGILTMAQLSRAECLKREYLHISRLRKKLLLEQKRKAAVAVMSVADSLDFSPTLTSSNIATHAHPALQQRLTNPKFSEPLELAMTASDKFTNSSHMQNPEDPKQDKISFHHKSISPSKRRSLRHGANLSSAAVPLMSVTSTTEPNAPRLFTQEVGASTSSNSVSGDCSVTLSDKSFEQFVSSPAGQSVTLYEDSPKGNRMRSVCMETSSEQPFRQRLPNSPGKSATSSGNYTKVKGIRAISLEASSEQPLEQFLSSSTGKFITHQSICEAPSMASQSSFNAPAHHSKVTIAYTQGDKNRRRTQREQPGEVTISKQMGSETVPTSLNLLQCFRSNSQAIRQDLSTLTQSFYKLCSETQESLSNLQLALGSIFRMMEFKVDENLIPAGEVDTVFEQISKRALKDLSQERVLTILSAHGFQLEPKEITNDMSDHDWLMQQMRLAVVNAAEDFVTPSKEVKINPLSYDTEGSAEIPSTKPPQTRPNFTRSKSISGPKPVESRPQKQPTPSRVQGPSVGSNTSRILEDVIANSNFITDVMHPHVMTPSPQRVHFYGDEEEEEEEEGKEEVEEEDQREFKFREYETTTNMASPRYHRSRIPSLTLEECRAAGLFLKGRPMFKETHWHPVLQCGFEGRRHFMNQKSPVDPPYKSVGYSALKILQFLRHLQSMSNRRSIEKIQPLVYSYRLGTTTSNEQQQAQERFALSVQSIFGNTFKEFVENNLLSIVSAAHSFGSGCHVDHSLLLAIHQLRKQEEARRQRSVQLLLRRVTTNIRTRLLARKYAYSGNAFYLYIMILYARWRADHEKARAAIKLDTKKNWKQLLKLVANYKGANIKSTSKNNNLHLPSIPNTYSRSLGPSSSHFDIANPQTNYFNVKR